MSNFSKRPSGFNKTRNYGGFGAYMKDKRFTGIGCSVCEKELTHKVLDYSKRVCGKPLCYTHQKGGDK